MTSDTRHEYVVFIPASSMSSPFVVDVPENARVQDLVNKVCESRDGKALGDEESIAYKCGVVFLYPQETLLSRISTWLRIQVANSNLPRAVGLKSYFPNGPAPSRDVDLKKMVIDVVIVTNSIMEKDDFVYALPDVNESRLIGASLKKASVTKEIRSPSEVIKDPRFLRNCVEHADVHIHRPASNFGPHTSLFNRAFARLKYRLEHLDDSAIWVPELEPDSELLGICHEFMIESCDVFDAEGSREILLKPFFKRVLGDEGEYKQPLQDGSAKPDATWGYPFRIIKEDKNEDGSGGNPSVQGNISYRKSVAQDSYKPYLARSNCPAIIIGVMGTRIEISTAVYIGGLYADKLISQELYIDAFQSRTILRLGRIAMALRHCYGELDDHYRFLALGADPTTRHLYPDPLPVEGSGPVPILEYMGKLTHGGQCIPVVKGDRSDKEAERERPYAIYRAKMDDLDGRVDVVVKFTARYNETAHRLLEEAELAPKLRYFARLVSGHCMVVMDYVDSPPLSDSPKQENFLDICERVGEAIQLLHNKKLVFGDLRPQNIVLDAKKRALLIDFDFTGTHGVDRYPASWDTKEHHPDARSHLLFLPEGAAVQDVDDAIRRRVKALPDDEDIIIYKCGVLSPEPGELLYGLASTWLRSARDSDILSPSSDLRDHFPSGPAPRKDENSRRVDLVIATCSKKDDFLYALPVRNDSRLITMSVKKACVTNDVRSPSEVIKDTKLLRNCVERADLHLHRPASNFGPHTSLFNRTFARLKYRLEHLDDSAIWVSELEPDSELLGTCHEFMIESCDVFDAEDSRASIVKRFFERVLCNKGQYKRPLQGRSVRPDVTWGYPFRFIIGVKNEDGLEGNASIQSYIFYRRSAAQESELYIDAFQAKTILRLGRIAMALRQCYDELDDHYRFLDLKTDPTIRHLYPDPLPVEGSGEIPTLEYMGKLSHGGLCISVVQKDRSDTLSEDERPYARYRAKMVDLDDRVDVVVKFTARYNETAHRLLEEAELAPKLYYFTRLVSGHCMVVMDYIDSPPLSDSLKQENYLEICDRVGEAVELLHEKNFVFGDFRPQNIVLDAKKRPLLIDFDFTGMHGVDRYPASWDTKEHHPDVRRHEIMYKEHDDFLLDKLRRLLKDHYTDSG
ncbi:hypothetical protein ACEPAG_2009 [Sanghuangporus baumii]